MIFHVDFQSYAALRRSRPTDRGGEPAALGRGVELGHRLPLRGKARRKDLPAPVAGEDMPAIAPQLVG
jgi:hypothetical protein